ARQLAQQREARERGLSGIFKRLNEKLKGAPKALITAASIATITALVTTGALPTALTLGFVAASSLAGFGTQRVVAKALHNAGIKHAGLWGAVAGVAAGLAAGSFYNAITGALSTSIATPEAVATTPENIAPKGEAQSVFAKGEVQAKIDVVDGG